MEWFKGTFAAGDAMGFETDKEHPIRAYFAEALHRALVEVGLAEDDDVEGYLLSLLIDFLHRDTIYMIRDAAGHRLESVAEMLAEGDVLLNADSFDREREVHKHIGDFLLFWSGVFPEHLKTMRAPGKLDALVNPVRQGQISYYVASTFRHDPYSVEAPTLLRLSEEFLGFQRGLTLVRASFEGFRRQGWPDGFEA